MKEESKKVTVRSKVFAGKTKGKFGKLTFGDLNNLARLLKNHKGVIPAGYSRRHCQACIIKTH